MQPHSQAPEKGPHTWATAHAFLALFSGSDAGEEERESATHSVKFPCVTCILLHYTTITVNFCLPAE